MRVIINNKKVLEHQLNAVEIWLSHQKLSKSKVLVSLSDEQISKQDIWKMGQEVVIEQDEKRIFEGVLIHLRTKVHSKGYSITLVAKSKWIYATINKKSKWYGKESLNNVIKDISSNYGYQNECGEHDDQKSALVQYDTTDWDFINLNAENQGLFLYENLGKVHLMDLESQRDEAVVLSKEAILNCEMEWNGVDAFEGIKMGSWNVDQDQMENEVISENQLYPELQMNLVQKSNLAAEEEQFYWSSSAFGDQSFWIQSKLAYQKLSSFGGHITLDDHYDLTPGKWVELRGFNKVLEGKSIVREVYIDWQGSYQRTHLKLGVNKDFEHKMLVKQKAFKPIGNELLLGKIQSYESENAEGIKVGVSLNHPAFQQEWILASILKNHHGMQMAPEIGSFVVIAFIAGNVENAIVLGTFADDQNQHPYEWSDENKTKGFKSQYGFDLNINEEEKEVKLTTPKGIICSFSDESEEFHLKDQHGNELIMNQEGMVLKSAGKMELSASKDFLIHVKEGLNIAAQMDFEVKGGNMIIEAQGDLSLESTQMKLSGQAICEINGGMVKIN